MIQPTFDDVDQIFPVMATSFAVAFPDFPMLGYLASSVDMPGWTVDRVRIEMFGKSREVPGRNVSSHTLSMTLIYDETSRAFRILHALLRSCVDPATGNRVGLPFSIIVEQYDSVGVLVQQRLFSKCWVSEVSGYQVSADSADTTVILPVTFYYQGQDVLYGPGAVGAPFIPSNSFALTGRDPRDVLNSFTQQLLATPPTVIDIIRTGAGAVAYGQAASGAVAQIANSIKAIASQVQSVVSTVKSTVSIVKSTASLIKSFF